MRCDRCIKPTDSFIQSMFNMELICCRCLTAEQQHPQYQAAVEAERSEVLKGNYNYPGVGKPADL